MDELRRAVPLLLEWFRGHKRDLPWRHGRNFYTSLVSEAMLQQTRVEAVKERYTEFLRRFPTAEVLANASPDEVMKAWEGLGYYSRARNLQAAARVIASNGVPRTYEEVRALPGVGDYTAGALCSVALGMKTPAVDGNVLRVLSRLLADEGNTDDGSVRKRYSDLLAEVYPPEAGDFTEALMELGAIVCVPNGAPLCGECPWNGLCRAHLAGEEAKYPVRAPKKGRRVAEICVFVLECGGKYALRKRGKGLLAGMWEFPNCPRSDFAAFGENGGANTFYDGSEVSVEERGAEETVLFDALKRGKIVAEKRAKHVFTHVEWHMTGYRVLLPEPIGGFVWATAATVRAEYAVPSAFKAFLPWLE